MHFLTANRHAAKTTKINKDTKKLEKGFLFSALHCLKLDSAIRNGDKRIRLPITPFSKFSPLQLSTNESRFFGGQ